MKDFGDLYYFFGLEVHRTSTQLFLMETKYLLCIFKSTNMLDCKPQSTLVISGWKLSNSDGHLLLDPMNIVV